MNINELFRKRIGVHETKELHFHDLPEILAKTAYTFPFENLCIIKGERGPVTREIIMAKTLERREGGLCYELNPLLYSFLQDNGFEVALVSGVVYNAAAKDWSSTGRTHVAILLQHHKKRYLIDTGFGGNLPLVPVPISGETVTSANGEFRIKKADHEYGDYCFEMKRRDKDVDWQIGYIFDTTAIIKDFSDLQEIQNIIVESKESNFNKSRLVTMLTPSGSMTLSNHSFTKWQDGQMSKEEISEGRFQELARQLFGLN